MSTNKELQTLRDENAALKAELEIANTSVAADSKTQCHDKVFSDEDQSPEALLARIADDQLHSVVTCLWGLVAQPFEDPHVEAAFQATYVCVRARFGCALMDVCCRPKGELFFASLYFAA